MRLHDALEETRRYGAADNLDRLREHIPTSWIEAALNWTGTVSIRRRRLPADQVVWLVIGMGLFHNEPIERVVDLRPMRVRGLSVEGVAQLLKRLA